jgi:hypothetical protein
MKRNLDPLPRYVQPRQCVGHMAREARRLQVRLELYPDEHVCDIRVEEDDTDVTVFALVCAPPSRAAVDEVWEVPCHVYLDRPLGDRTVRDGHYGCAVPYRNVYDELKAEYPELS